MDTDYCAYGYRPGMPSISTGTFLGEMTNELTPGDTIREFISLGPKSYYYRTPTGEVKNKSKGFPLKVESAEALDPEIMKKQLVKRLMQKESFPLFDEDGLKKIMACKCITHCSLEEIRRDILSIELLTKSYDVTMNKRARVSLVIPDS